MRDGVLRRRGRAGLPHAGRPRTDRRHRRKGPLLPRARTTSQPGVKPYLPAPADRTRRARGARDSRGPDRRSHGQLEPDGRLRLGRARRATGRSCASAVRNNGAITRPAPAPGPRVRVRQVRSPRRSTPTSTRTSASSPRRSARASRRRRRLDHAPHRQLGDGRAELDRATSARSSSGGAATIRCRYLPAYTGRVVGSLEQQRAVPVGPAPDGAGTDRGEPRRHG